MIFRSSGDLPDLSLLVGKIGSGKTSFSERFKGQGAVVLNSDEIMKPLFGQTLGRERYVKNLTICSQYLFSLADQILDSGLKVILDFGFWEKETRDTLRSRFAKREFRFLYLPVSDQEQWLRIQKRNQKTLSSYPFMKEDLAKLNRFFDDPGKDGTDDVILVEESSLQDTQ